MNKLLPVTLGILAIATSHLFAALSSPWVDQDIGSVAVAGSANDPGGVFTVKGSGADIFGAADGFNYCYQTLSGNFTFTARLTSAGGTGVNGGAASGIMIRESTAANSRHLMVYSEPGGYKRYVQRYLTGGSSVRVGIATGAFPMWYRVTRSGDLAHVYWSADGVNWTQSQAISFAGMPASVCVGLAVTSRANGVLNTATFDNVSITSVPADAATSWLGNTWSGGWRCVGFGVSSIYVSPTTGRMYVNGQSESFSTAIYDTNGNFVAPCANSHFNGGYAITADDTYIYSAQSPVTSGTTNAGIAIYDQNGVSASATILLPARTIRGLACNKALGELYIADTGTYGAGPDTLRVFSTSSRTELRSFAVPRARNLAVAPDGSLWIVQDGDGGSNAPKVLHYSNTGTPLSGTITGIASPRGIAIDNAGKIYVTDTGVDQNVKIYTSTGAPSGTFGALNGVYGGTRGEIAPTKLNNPVGVGVDNSGNIWVACNGPRTAWADLAGGTGAALRKYTISGSALQWERLGLEYVDCASADPGTDGVDVYTKFNHYVMDYSKPPGQGWTHKGMTIDQFTYPGDPRLSLTTKMGSAMVRRIGGNRYLFITDQQGGFLWFYRFQSGSEIAVPLGYLQRETHRGFSDNRFGIWHDADGDGVKDASEFDTTGAAAGAPSNETYCFTVDSTGGVWTTDGSKVRCYAPQIDANGNLYYASAQMTSWNYPAAFVGTNAYLLRACYDAASGDMYLAGYTTDAPKPDLSFGLIGTRIIKYTNYKTSPAEAYRITVPRNVAANIGARAMDIGGDLVAFVIGLTSEVYLHDAASGALLTKMNAGPNTGIPGVIDCNNGLQLFARSNGETLAFVEEDNECKVLMHRYNPFYLDKIGTVSSGTGTINPATGTYTVTGAGTDIWNASDNFEYCNRALTGDGTIIARVSSMTVTSGTGAINISAKAGLMIRESLAANSKFVDVVMTPSTNGACMQNRSTTGASAVQSGQVSAARLPQWLKLVRSGNSFTGYCSTNGTTWTQIGATVSVPMNQAVYVGFAVTAHNNNQACTAVFDNLTIAP
jgi:regulation of enolase protein 1 (concanavalin A-like superfamily)